jgi:hypothetical protein
MNTETKTVRGLLFNSDGWLIPQQFLAPTARIVYASTTDGDDATAAKNQYGRSFYLPTDPVIGPDPTNPIGPVYAHATLNSAYTASRCFPIRDSGNPDWLLFKRGDTFDVTTNTLYRGVLVGPGLRGGPSVNASRVFGAYGDASVSRPKFININSTNALWTSGAGTSFNFSSFYFFSLHFEHTQGTVGGFVQLLGSFNSFIMEDVLSDGRGLGTMQSSGPFPSSYILRRCVASEAFQVPYQNSSGIADPHTQGLFLSSAAPKSEHWLSENIFDMSGYREDPKKPSTWTAGVSSNLTRGELPAGDFSSGINGVQPTRTWFDRDLYLSSYTEMELEGNIISRGAGGSSVQMRVQGTAKNNAFLWNHQALTQGGSESSRPLYKDGTIENNLVLHDDHMIAPGGFSLGVTTGIGNEQIGTIKSNLVLHFIRPSNGRGAYIAATGIPPSPKGDLKEDAKLITIEDNVAVGNHNLIFVEPVNTAPTIGGVQQLQAGRNAFVKLTGEASWIGVSAKDTFAQIGTKQTGANHYYAPKGWKEFSSSDWKTSGKDVESVAYHCLPDLAAVLGWQANAWEKDIVSYMQHVDPTYVPDENVTVDFAAPVANRRANAPTVWSVLKNSELYGGGVKANLSEADAKLTARRYHAFITFITRAKANRKGSWDEKYTANAINNYFRTQFNKSVVSKSV